MGTNALGALYLLNIVPEKLLGTPNLESLVARLPLRF